MIFIPQSKISLYLLVPSLLICILFLNWNYVWNEKIKVQTSNGSLQYVFREASVAEISQTCTPLHHIVYLKMHKCASSTVQNLLLRYALRNHLSVALMNSGNHIFAGASFPSSLTPLGKRFDVFTLHTTFNVRFLQKVTHKDSFWMTSVRDPRTLFESRFMYNNIDQKLKGNLSYWLSRPDELLKQKKNGKLNVDGSLFESMSRDLGYNNPQISTAPKIVQKMEQSFHHILIAEYFDESLVLMRHHLCWTIDDILAISANTRREQFRVDLTDEMRETIRKINPVDTFLYEHFLKKHKEKVKLFGEQRMNEEVLELRRRRDDMKKRCNLRPVSLGDKSMKHKQFSNRVSLLKVQSDERDYFICSLMTLPEKHLINIVRKYQTYLVQEELLP